MARCGPPPASAQLLSAAFLPRRIPGAREKRFALLRTMRLVYDGELGVHDRQGGIPLACYLKLGGTIRGLLEQYGGLTPTLPRPKPMWGFLQVWFEEQGPAECDESLRGLLGYLFPAGGWQGLYGTPTPDPAAGALLPQDVHLGGLAQGKGRALLLQNVHRALRDCLVAWVATLLQKWLPPTADWQSLRQWVDEAAESGAHGLPAGAADIIHAGVAMAEALVRPPAGSMPGA